MVEPVPPQFVPATSQEGPRLVALTALLMGCFRQSKHHVALFLEQVLNQYRRTSQVSGRRHCWTRCEPLPFTATARTRQTSQRIDPQRTRRDRVRIWFRFYNTRLRQPEISIISIRL